jgi:hypothetical protein
MDEPFATPQSETVSVALNDPNHCEESFRDLDEHRDVLSGRRPGKPMFASRSWTKQETEIHKLIVLPTAVFNC